MLNFTQSLLKGFVHIPNNKERSLIFIDEDGKRIIPDGYFSFKFGENDEYELAFEPLLFDNQWYVAVYKDQQLLTTKVCVKPGK